MSIIAGLGLNAYEMQQSNNRSSGPVQATPGAIVDGNAKDVDNRPSALKGVIVDISRAGRAMARAALDGDLDAALKTETTRALNLQDAILEAKLRQADVSKANEAADLQHAQGPVSRDELTA